MARDPRNLDQNPVVIDPAKVDAVLDDRPTKVSDPLAPPMDEIPDTSEEPDPTDERPDGAPRQRVLP